MARRRKYTPTHMPYYAKFSKVASAKGDRSSPPHPNNVAWVKAYREAHQPIEQYDSLT